VVSKQPGYFMMTKIFSIKTKFFIIILIPALILLFVIYLDYVHLSSLGSSAEHILSKNYKSIQTAQQIRQLMDENRNQILMALFQDTLTVQHDFMLNRNIPPLLTICRDNITEAGEKEIIDNLTETYKKYNPLFSGFMENRKNSMNFFL